MAFLVCLPRIYLGTHDLTDVPGGATTGIFAAIVVHFLYRENGKPDRIAAGIL